MKENPVLIFLSAILSFEGNLVSKVDLLMVDYCECASYTPVTLSLFETGRDVIRHLFTGV